MVLAPVGGRRAFDHRGLADGDGADLALAALAVPLHADEHLAFVLRDGERALRCSAAVR